MKHIGQNLKFGSNKKLLCCEEGGVRGDCRAELNQILAGGPKLIYYNK